MRVKIMQGSVLFLRFSKEHKLFTNIWYALGYKDLKRDFSFSLDASFCRNAAFFQHVTRAKGMFMNQLISRLKKSRFFQSKTTAIWLTVLYPIALYCFAELGQMQSLSEVLAFTWSRFRVAVFGCLLVAAVFWTLNFLFRRVWIGASVTGALFMIISTVEYHKYYVSGCHLLFSDLAFVKGIADVSKFARLRFNPLLFLLFILTALYIICIWMTGMRLKGSLPKRASLAAVVGGVTAMAIVVPAFFAPVCTVFGIDNTLTYNTYDDDERFANNNLITNFTVSINQTLTSTVQQPEEYSQEAIDELLVAVDGESVSVKPNVIYIMSESYGDFRRLGKVKNGDQIYAALDEVLAEGAYGTSVVPTYGNGTVRTEFELMFGLPVKSLNNAGIPHQLLKSGVEQDTFANMYKSQGYNTTYIHPYRSNFYDREEVYSEYGFDQMLFMDDLTVEVNNYRDFIDDDTAFRQAEAVLKSTDGPDYIHITTMQNHQPYLDDQGGELENYFDGIQTSNEALREFTNFLKTFDEPTILVFTGDHFPFFTPECNYYRDMGITVDNCEKLYEKTWLVWNNYDLDTSSLPKATFSTFYLPHLVYQLAGFESPFVNTILKEMATRPIYSIAVNPSTNSELLDLLTYDRTMGNSYSEPEHASMNIDD